MAVYLRLIQSSVWGQGRGAKRTAYLGPGPSPPPPRAELTVAGPAALRAVVIAVFGVHGAGGVVVQGLNAADGAHLHASSPTALTARLPFTGDPPAGAEWQVVREPVWLRPGWAMRTEMSACSLLQRKLFLVSQKHPPRGPACMERKLRLRYSRLSGSDRLCWGSWPKGF